MVLLNDLLDLSKLEAGKAEYELKPTNLVSLIEEAVLEFNTSLCEKEIHLTIDPPKIPTLVTCDEFKISQVVRNLIANAIRYSKRGSGITIQFLDEPTNGEQGKNFLETLIIDEGIGIPNEELNLIFEKFSQSSLTKNGAGGTGLGLSICKQIITDHDGEIWADSSIEEGTTIHFTLPYA